MMQVRSMAAFSLLWWVVGAASAAEFNPIDVQGSESILFVWRAVKIGDQKESVVYFAQATLDAPILRFRPISTEPVPDSLVHVVARGMNLHLFFSDGGHYRLSAPRQSSSLAWLEAPERTLPQRYAPLAVVADKEHGALIAIVAARIAVQLQTPTTQPEASPESDEPAIGPVEAPAGYWLVRYANGAWQAVDAIPDFFDPKGFHHLACDEDVCHLFYSDARSADVLRHALRDDNSWQEAGIVPGIRPKQLRTSLIVQDDISLIITGDTNAGSESLSILTQSNGAWSQSPALTIQNKTARFPAGKIGVDAAGGKIAVVWMDGPDEPKAGLWPVDGTEPIKGPTRVLPMVRPGGVGANQESNQLIATAVIIVLVTIVFIARRDSFLVDAKLPPGSVLAPLGRRLIAFLIDLSIVLLIVYPALFETYFRAHIDLAHLTLEDRWIVFQLNPEQMFWRWIAAAGVFILYAAILEGFSSATAGKRIMRLWVVGDRGQRCTVKSVAIRNLLRIIELYPNLLFVPTLVFVVLTRNHQRIGDLMARTVVVAKKREATVPGAADQSSAGDDVDQHQRND